MNYSSNKALFLDRDGVINIDHGHVHSIESFDFIEGIFDLCRIAQQKGYLIIVITNQAGIGKGFYSEDDFHKLNHWMIEQFRHNGIIVSKTYYCPHKPEDNCYCRKPNPGMLLKAIEEFNICPFDSILIGDKKSDIIAGQNANIQTCILFKGNDYKDMISSFQKMEKKL
jgi:D-glycero-D-manno-heptose 1,7-bisphosphate phosphatase